MSYLYLKYIINIKRNTGCDKLYFTICISCVNQLSGGISNSNVFLPLYNRHSSIPCDR